MPMHVHVAIEVGSGEDWEGLCLFAVTVTMPRSLHILSDISYFIILKRTSASTNNGSIFKLYARLIVYYSKHTAKFKISSESISISTPHNDKLILMYTTQYV